MAELSGWSALAGGLLLFLSGVMFVRVNTEIAKMWARSTLSRLASRR